jgi:hypothetical protein
MTTDPAKTLGDSEVFRFGGFGTVLLISLLAFIGLYPLLLGEIAGRLAGGLILAAILVSSVFTASRSRTHHVIGIGLAVFALGLQVVWLQTHNRIVEATAAAIFAFFSVHRAPDLSPRPFLRTGLC